MSHRIITISRELGCDGTTIGKKVAEKLGINCYDKEILDKIVEETGFSKDYVKEAGEYTHSILSAIFASRTNGPTNQDVIWSLQSNLILELAENESCVIVGRCADYILREHHDCIKVFIHANMDVREKRIAEKYGETKKSPKQRLKEKDKQRAAYYRFYTKTKWGQAQNYHITLDSGKLGIDKCVDIISELYRKL